MQHRGYVVSENLSNIRNEIKKYPSIKFVGSPIHAKGNKSYVVLDGRKSDFNKLLKTPIFEEPDDF